MNFRSSRSHFYLTLLFWPVNAAYSYTTSLSTSMPSFTYYCQSLATNSYCQSMCDIDNICYAYTVVTTVINSRCCLKYYYISTDINYPFLGGFLSIKNNNYAIPFGQKDGFLK